MAAQVGVIGGGAWGTALAATAARAGRRVMVWAREPDVVEAINTGHENRRFLPDVPLDPAVQATNDIAHAARAELLLMTTPAQHLRAVATTLASARMPEAAVVLCAKGIERESGALMSEVAAAVLEGAPLAVLSGPTFAREVAAGQPTAVTLACAEGARGEALVAALGSPAFRPYLTDDVIGAQIGGAVKNVLAIAAGIAVGRGLGDNARAAITARGFAEITRLAVALGARAETLAGLSGLGDLILTCTSTQSRNYTLGQALGAGQTLAEILAARESVTEGVASAPAVLALARRRGIDMPIATAVASVLGGETTIDETIGALLARPFKPEGALTS